MGIEIWPTAEILINNIRGYWILEDIRGRNIAFGWNINKGYSWISDTDGY